MYSYFTGLLLGFSLIMALGPQNIFLMRQAIRGHHPWLSASLCFFCDTLLIISSIAGLSHLLSMHPGAESVLLIVGSLFLCYYGVASLKSSLRDKKNAHDKQRESKHSNIKRIKVILLALSFSLLNPQAIIDTLVMIGGSASQFKTQVMQYEFMVGAISSSFLWFFTLTFIATEFSSTLSKPKVWQYIEGASGVLMLGFSVKMLFALT
jgi:L-lysine exporter family protein LysE/ArgO